MSEAATIALDAFIRAMSKVTEKLFAERGQMTPHFIGDTPAGVRVVCPLPGRSRLSADDTALIMRELAKEHAMVRCCMIDEAWVRDVKVAEMPPGELAALKARLDRDGVRNDPERVEKVIFLAEDYVTGGLKGSRDIVRPAHGKPYLGKLEIRRYHSGEGRFAGLLPPRGNMQ